MQNINLDSIFRQLLFKLKSNCIYTLDTESLNKINQIYISKGYNEIKSNIITLQRKNTHIYIYYENKEIFNTEINDFTTLALTSDLALALAFELALSFTLAFALAFAIIEGSLYNSTDQISFLDEQKTVAPLITNSYLELYD